MRQQPNLSISAASARRDLGRSGWIAALIASLLLNPSDDVSAQGVKNTRPLNLGPAPQQSADKWYSKYVPWKQSSESTQFKMPPKRQVTTVGEPSDKVRDEGQLSFARLSERRGQPEQAKAIYEAFIIKQPNNPLPFHRLGVMAAREGDFKKCDDYLSKAFYLDGENPELLADIGYSMYLRGLTADAETFYRRALEHDRDHEAAANNLAMLLVETGRHNEGLAVFKRVNDDAEAYANQGYILAQTGELEEAKKYFNHALTVDSSLKQAAKGLMQVAEYQDRSRTAPEFRRERTPEQLAGTTQQQSRQPETRIAAKPDAATAEFASMVSIEDKERTLAAPPSPSAETSAVSPPPVMIADAEPTASSQIVRAQLTNQRAQDVSVRNVSKIVPITNARLPEVIQSAREDLSPPPVIVQQTPKRENASPLPVVIQQSTAREDVSPPPVHVQQATTWPPAGAITSADHLAQDRMVPQMNPVSSVFSTRVSDSPEPMQLPSTQSVPESSMPTSQSRARSRWGENPVRAAAMGFEAQQPLQPRSADVKNWAEQPHSNLALQSIAPVTQFQPQPQAQPVQSNVAREFNPFGSHVGDRN